ncbi:MAG: FecR domain-containing protein [Cellvibrio sp.]|uniref:FecR domain-containing protein n=1 Tax=Cellvibrio sp. TaxID=1965322 RepID=UPI0031AACBC4
MTAPLISSQGIDRRVAREASRWFVLLQGDASSSERADCARWRQSHPDHEQAWQLAEHFHAQITQIPADIGLPTLDRPRNLDRRATLKMLTLLIIAAPVGAISYRDLPWRRWSADVRTAVGEHRELALPDGSKLHLNTDSAVDIAFTAEQRLLCLRAGEILIETAPDAANRPFIVETREGSLHPLGTRFCVRQLSAHTQVSVMEGVVELRPAKASPSRLTAGEQTRFNQQGVTPAIALPTGASDWTRGVLRADKTPLAEFAAELARYRPGFLRCDPAVADLTISGSFQLKDTDQALAALSRSLPVEIYYRTRYWVTIAAKETTQAG